jgi:hypothetical protein
MNSKRIALGIGIVLLVLAVLTAHASAHKAYFVPQHSNATTGNTTTMDLYVEIDDAETTLGGGQVQIKFDPTRARVTENYLLCQYVDPTGPDQYCWGSFDTNFDSERNGYMWGGVSTPQESKYYDPPGPSPLGWYYVETATGWFDGPVTVPVGTYTIEANGTPGVSPFNFGFEHFPLECPACQKTMFVNKTGREIFGITWENGTFTHVGEPETFTTSLAPDWNLLSLPLTPLDDSTSAVLGNGTFVYDKVYSYDASTNQFVDVTDGTMETGVGYFVDVTTAGTWSYDGTAYDTMSVPLSQGLNCVGWTNTSADIPDGALDSIAGDYRYVARWNAAEQKYELYDAMAPPGVPEFIDFTTMERGVGYFIAATAGCTLTYP